MCRTFSRTRGNDRDVTAIYRHRNAVNAHSKRIEPCDRKYGDFIFIHGSKLIFSAVAQRRNGKLRTRDREMHRRSAAGSIRSFRYRYGKRVTTRLCRRRHTVPLLPAVRHTRVQIRDGPFGRTYYDGFSGCFAEYPTFERNGRIDLRFNDRISSFDDGNFKIIRTAYICADRILAYIAARLTRKNNRDILSESFPVRQISQLGICFTVHRLFIFDDHRYRRFIHHDCCLSA